MIRFVGGHKLNNEEIAPLIGKIKGLIYARVSTSDQVDKYSLSSQIDECMLHAFDKFGYKEDELVALIEEGQSGDDPNRPALNNALQLLEKGVGKKLIVLHPDRLSRSLSLQTMVSEKIWNLGCDIEFKQFDLDPNNPESVLMYNIQGSIAQYNKAKILANSKRGRLKKIQEQKLMGIRRIYGYTYDKENDTLTINEVEKETFLRIVNMLINDDISISEIAKILSKENIPAPSGGVWYQSTISKMLQNETYTGNFYYGKTRVKQLKGGKKKQIAVPREEWMLVKIPPLIDKATYELIQKKIKALTKLHTGRPSEHGLLKGIARCGRCGSSVSINSKSKLKDKTLSYYGCNRRGAKGYVVGTGEGITQRCKGRNWRVDVIDDYVWKYLVAKLSNPEQVITDITETQGDSQKISELQNKKEVLQLALSEKKQIVDRYNDLYAMGRIKTVEELDEKIEPIQEQVDELEYDINVIDERLATIKMSYDELELLKNKLIEYAALISFDKTPPDKKRAIIQSMIKKVILHEDVIEIHTTWSTDDIASSHSSSHQNIFFHQGDGVSFDVEFITQLPKPKWGGDDFVSIPEQHQVKAKEIKRLYEDELLSFVQIGNRLGIDWWVVRGVLEKIGVQIQTKEERYKLRRQRDFNFIYDLHYNQGLTLKQIYMEYNLTPEYVRKVLKENGLSPIKRNQFGVFKS